MALSVNPVFSRHLLTVLLISLFLVACGGGGGSSSNDGSSNDGSSNGGGGAAGDTSIAVTLEANHSKVRRGGSVELTPSASTVDSPVKSETLSCSAGTLNGIVLSIREDENERTIKCSYTATNEAGESATATATIDIMSVVVEVITQSDPIKTMQPVVLAYGGMPEVTTPVRGRIGDRSVELHPTGAYTMSFLMPAGISGEVELELVANDLPITVPLSVRESAPIANPRQLVDSTLNWAIGDLVGSTDPLDLYMLDALEQLRDGLDSLSPDEMAELALFITSLQPEPVALYSPGTGFLKTSSFSMQKGLSYTERRAACRKATAGVIVDGSGLIAGLAVMGGGLYTMPATGLGGAAAVGFGVWVVRQFRGHLRDNLAEATLYCGDVNSLSFSIIPDFDSIIPDYDMLDSGFTMNSGMGMQKLGIAGAAEITKTTAPSASAPSRLVFENAVEKSMMLSYTVAHSDESDGKKIDSMLSRLRGVLNTTNDLLGGVLDDLLAEIPAVIDYELTLLASDLQVLPVSTNNIVGSAAAVDGEVMTFTYEFEDVDALGEKGYLDFTLEFQHRESGEVYSLPARLKRGDLPTANDAHYVVLAGEGVGGVLEGEDAEEFALLSTGDHGLATLLMANTGQFGYDAPEDYHGEDSFQFVARNLNGESPPATVTIMVLEGCTDERGPLTMGTPGEASLYCPATDEHPGRRENVQVSPGWNGDYYGDWELKLYAEYMPMEGGILFDWSGFMQYQSNPRVVEFWSHSPAQYYFEPQTEIYFAHGTDTLPAKQDEDVFYSRESYAVWYGLGGELKTYTLEFGVRNGQPAIQSWKGYRLASGYWSGSTEVDAEGQLAIRRYLQYKNIAKGHLDSDTLPWLDDGVLYKHYQQTLGPHFRKPWYGD